MAIRKLTLEEWFLHYQLKRVKKNHFHLPFELNVDVTDFITRSGLSPQKIPWTAISIKALGQLAFNNPKANRMLFDTFYGLRILEPTDIRVNVPIYLRNSSGRYLAVCGIINPHLKSILEIKLELERAKEKPLEKTLVGKYVYNQRNSFLNRIRLKILHFLVFNFPLIYKKGGGGALTLSSLTNSTQFNTNVRIHAFGPTCLTVCLGDIARIGSRWELSFGVGFDHYCMSGDEGTKLIRQLSQMILNQCNIESLDFLSAPLAPTSH